MKRFPAVILLMILFTAISGMAQESADTMYKKNLRSIAELRNSCHFGEIIDTLEDLHKKNPDSFSYTEMLFAYLLRAGEFDRAVMLKDLSAKKYGKDASFMDKIDELNSLIKFYRERDFEKVSDWRQEQTLSPFAFEAVILSSILTGSDERFEACQKFEKVHYTCLLARKSMGSYVPINMTYRAKLPSLILSWCNGDINRKELDGSLDSCLESLPAFREILGMVLDKIEEKAR